MSRQNKVNPGQYTTAGRLSPDDLGRERQRQRDTTTGGPQVKKPAWETSSPSPKSTPIPKPTRAEVAAARAVLGLSRVAVGAVQALTTAARKVAGAATRTVTTPARSAPPVKSAPPAKSGKAATSAKAAKAAKPAATPRTRKAPAKAPRSATRRSSER